MRERVSAWTRERLRESEKWIEREREREREGERERGLKWIKFHPRGLEYV